MRAVSDDVAASLCIRVLKVTPDEETEYLLVTEEPAERVAI